MLKFILMAIAAVGTAWIAGKSIAIRIRDKELAENLRWPIFFGTLFTTLAALFAVLEGASVLTERLCRWEMFRQHCGGRVTPETPEQVAIRVEKAAAEAAAAAAAAKAAADLKAATDAKAQADARRAVKAAEEERRRMAALTRVAVLTPGAGKTEWAKDPLRDGSTCDVCPDMVVAPAGSFSMGRKEAGAKDRDGPVTRVAFGRPFAFSRFSITRGEWKAFTSATGWRGVGCHVYRNHNWPRDDAASWMSVGFVQTDRDPVVCITWDDAMAYVTSLGGKTGKPYRLLSEAEREYITRAGTTTDYWWGDGIDNTEKANNLGRLCYNSNDSECYHRRTLPVDKLGPNPWGAYHVHGNAWDWTADCWFDRHSGGTVSGAPRVAEPCDRHVVRGGSWYFEPKELQSSYRHWRRNAEGANHVTLRVARDL